MKQNNWRITANLFIIFSLLLATGCKKEKTPEPSYLDENYFVIEDKPNDPVDHAIYNFYRSTGIASYYNDTIYRKQTGEIDGVPRYSYIKLSLNYTPLGNTFQPFKPLSSKEKLPALLNVLEQQVIPKLPDDLLIPSILFIDSFWKELKVINIQIADGMTAVQGFNTVGIVVKDAAVMNEDEKRMYGASILAGLAENQLKTKAAGNLQTDFFSVSRTAAKTVSPYDIYIGVPFALFMTPNQIPPAQNLGFLRYISNNMLNIPIPSYLTGAPREMDDIRAYLTAVFYYTTQEFTTINASYPLVMQKFSIIRNMVLEAGFKLPE